MAIPCVPVFGRLIDTFGIRMHALLCAVAFLIPFDVAMALTTWNAIPFLLLCGASYSLVASSLWPSLCKVVPTNTVGSANGICTSIQMIGIGCANLIVGALRDAYTYTEVMLFLCCCGFAATVFAVIAEFLDYKLNGSRLNLDRPLKTPAVVAAAAQHPPDDEKSPLKST
eukprot:TRINITY_DN244_c0_g1_i6.p2 TRINITY_DN244_c0_g1~~TRINITY_DN244_c0_g1_i6.p2  ORF type:complete len:170 (-),score=48.06 TRINITY_DN244_c0_g1_i6:43-552(-)